MIYPSRAPCIAGRWSNGGTAASITAQEYTVAMLGSFPYARYVNAISLFNGSEIHVIPGMNCACQILFMVYIRVSRVSI